MLRIGINGFGRIGRSFFRINSQKKLFKVEAINDIDPNVANHGYLLKYDSIHGRFERQVEVSADGTNLLVNNEPIHFYSFDNISDVPWSSHNVDVVIDATGVDKNIISCRNLISGKDIDNVIFTHSPSESVDLTLVFGVNEDDLDPESHKVIAASTCDATATAPILFLINEAFGIQQGYITTLHPWLSYQNLLDGSVRSVASPGHYWEDFSLGRASNTSLIPKNTTLIQALSKVIPNIAKSLDAISFRVPTGIVAASDLSLVVASDVTVDEVNELLLEESRINPDLIGYSDDHLVSVDFTGIEQAVFVDARWTHVQNQKMIKLVLWYDNEWGYCHRVLDLVSKIEEVSTASKHSNG